MGKRMQTLDRTANKIGTFWGAGKALDAGRTTETVTGDMTAAELHDATNWVRLSLYADFGAGPRLMARSPEWNGGPAQTAPAVSYQFTATALPLLVYGVLENGTRGTNSGADCGLVSTSS
jgi:hypothetical protein